MAERIIAPTQNPGPLGAAVFAYGDQPNEYTGVRVAVLGASGFIGRWVARLLSMRGAYLQLLVRDEAAAEMVFARYNIHGAIHPVDFSDPGALEGCLERVRPSITFNLAGHGIDPSERDERTAFCINAELVATLCAAVAEIRDSEWRGQDLVHVGSGFEYGTARGDLSEETIPQPETLYATSKLAGTNLLAAGCRARHIKGLTARPFTVYGAGEHERRLLPSLLQAARTRTRLPLTAGTQLRDFTYVEDVAMGLLRLGLSDAVPGTVVNLATGRLSSVRSFAEEAASVLRIPPDDLEFGALPTRPDEMQHGPVSVERLRWLAGWVPSTPIAAGVQKTWEFEKEVVCS